MIPESTTGVSPAFELHATPRGRVLRASLLSETAVHCFTTRDVTPAGVHQPGYDEVGEALGISADCVARVRQVHGRDVLVITSRDGCPADAEADAIVTTVPGQAVSVRVADCVPILMADRRKRAAAAVHAGWRGTASGVVAATVETLARLGVPASDLVVAIGPSVGPCCYQVDTAVRDSFKAGHSHPDAWFRPDGDRWRLDLWRANRDQLETCGVPASAIVVASACTMDGPDLWFSHRREGAAAGRMVAAIRLGRPPR